MQRPPFHEASSIGSFHPGEGSDALLGGPGTYFFDARAVAAPSYPSFVGRGSSQSHARTVSGRHAPPSRAPSIGFERAKTILRCSASKTDPALLLCDETIAIGASPESAVATLTAHFSKATAAPPPPLPSLPPFGQVRTVLNVLVVTSALDVHALPMEVILRDDITRVGTSKEAARVVELLGGHTQVYVTRCTDGRLLFLARTPGLARALMHAGLLWTAEVAPTTQAALLFPVSLESKIVMGRAVQAVLFGTHATIAVHNLDPDLMGPVADAWSPAAALGVPTSTDPDRAMLTEHLVGRAWTEQTRRAALETMRRHVQDQVAWQRYCEALQAMDDARQTAELFILVNALFGNVTRDVFRGVDEYVCKFLGM